MASTGFEGGQLILPGLVSDATALTAAKFRFVQMGTATVGGLWQAATAGQQGILGVAQENAANVGDPIKVCGGGITKVEAGVAITKGAKLTTDTLGRAITAAATASHHVYGIALEAASAAGSIIAMAFSYHGPAVNNS